MKNFDYKAVYDETTKTTTLYCTADYTNQYMITSHTDVAIICKYDGEPNETVNKQKYNEFVTKQAKLMILDDVISSAMREIKDLREADDNPFNAFEMSALKTLERLLDNAYVFKNNIFDYYRSDIAEGMFELNDTTDEDAKYN